MWMKTVAMVLVCLFSFNNLSFSQSEKVIFTCSISDSTLAPQLLLKQKLRVLSGLIGGEILQYTIANPGVNVIASDGFVAAGKSTMISEIKEYLETQGKDVEIIMHDWFLKGRVEADAVVAPYLAAERRYASNGEETYEYERFIEVLERIKRFKDGLEGDLEVLEIQLDNLYIRGKVGKEGTTTIRIRKDTVVLIDGTNMLTDRTREYFNQAFFYDISQEEQFRRVLKREEKKSPKTRKSLEKLKKRVRFKDRPRGEYNRAQNLRFYDYHVDTTDDPKVSPVRTVQKYGLEVTYANGRLASVNRIVGTDKEEVRAALVAAALKADDEESIKTIIDVINDGVDLFDMIEKTEIILEVEYNFALKQRRQQKESHRETNEQKEGENSLIIDVCTDMKEIQPGGPNSDTILLIPLKRAVGEETLAVAVNLSWIREYYYLNYWEKPLAEWCKKYSGEENSITKEDLEQLKIWPIVSYDNPDRAVISRFSRGIAADPVDEDSSLSRVSFTQLRDGLDFTIGRNTHALQYPEVIALIDGVEFYFPEIRRLNTFSSLTEGGELDRNPDWFRSFPGLQKVWRGRTCPNCGSKEHSAGILIGPVRSVECASCGMGFTNPVASLEKGDLDRYATGKELDPDKLDNMKRAKHNAAEFMKVLNEHFPEMLHQPILDVGCASGEMMKVLRDDYGWPNENLYGVEPSKYAADYARENYGLNVFNGTLETAALEGKKYKGIFFFHSLEHIEEPVKILRKAHEFLEEDGVVGIIGVPNHRSLSAFLHPERPYHRNFPDGQHVLEFNRRTLSDMLKRTGFRVVHAHDGIFRDLKNETDDMYSIALWIGWVFGVDVETVGNDQQQLLRELERTFRGISETISRKWGTAYNFEIKKDDFKTIENLITFYDRISWKSSLLFDIILVWGKKWQEKYNIAFDLEAIDREFSSETHPDTVRENKLDNVESSFRKTTMIGANMVNRMKQNITEPVDIHIDLSLIPENDLEGNLQEWALIIKSCKDLPVNFMFDSTDESYKARAAFRLKEIVPEMKNRINVSQAGALKLVIKHVKDLDQVEKDEYPIAMAGENISNGNVVVRDFNAAVNIGLLQAVLVMNKDEQDFQILVDQVKLRLKKIYNACGIEREIGDAEIEQLTSDDPTERIKFAIKVALPPICRYPLEVLQTIHENNRMILEMA